MLCSQAKLEVRLEAFCIYCIAVCQVSGPAPPFGGGSRPVTAIKGDHFAAWDTTSFLRGWSSDEMNTVYDKANSCV